MKNTTLLLCLLPLAAAPSCKFLYKQVVDHADFWPNGLPKSRGTLAGDKQTGEWLLSYESGKPLAKGRYDNDRQVGPWTFYYESGGVERSGSFDAKGLRTGAWQYDYEDQTPKARGSYVADNEDGPWVFYGPDGAVTMEGQYDAGKQSGLWRFYYPGGAPKAEGLYLRGDRVGPWRLWNEQQVGRVQDFGLKPGLQLVRELWPGTDRVRRVGVRQNGAPVGRWTTFHENGAMHFCCAMLIGRPEGVFEARDADGSVLAQGVFRQGLVEPGAIAVRQGESGPFASGPLPAKLDGREPVTDPSAMPVEERIALQVSLAMAPPPDPAFAPFEVDAAAPAEVLPPAAAQAVVAALDDGPTRMPAAPQPQLTVKQKKELRSYVAEYTDGAALTGSVFQDYAPDTSKPRPRGQGTRSELVGKALPFDTMKCVDGSTVDLTGYRGKQKVMVVVLRGFVGEVCCYCVAQTKALAKIRGKLEQANVEVLVIYPGPKENELAFRQLYELEFGEGPPPYRVFYDPNLELVSQLGIRGDLAFPTTLILDEQGIVRYAYVGEHRADRPATKELLQQIEGIR